MRVALNGTTLWRPNRAVSFRMPSPGKKRSTNDSDLSRRGWLKTVVGIAAGTAVSGCTGPLSRPRPRQAGHVGGDRIRLENERPGTQDWLLTQARIDPATQYRCPWVEGYCSRTSVSAGDTLNMFVNTCPASDFSLEIYRM